MGVFIRVGDTKVRLPQFDEEGNRIRWTKSTLEKHIKKETGLKVGEIREELGPGASEDDVAEDE